MNTESVVIQPSKVGFRVCLVAGVSMGLFAVWFGYQTLTGRPYLQDSLGWAFTASVLLLIGIVRYSGVITYRQGVLTRKNVFGQQQVRLDTLVRATKFSTFSVGAIPPWVYRLEDAQGGRVDIVISNYDDEQRNALAALIRKYAFIEGVEKNFVDLPLYVRGGYLPRTSIRHVLTGTFLYLFLPAMVLTVLLISWAIFTNQPDFQ